MEREMHEGPEAKERFEDAMKTIFKAPKTIKIKQQDATPAASVRKPKSSGKD